MSEPRRALLEIFATALVAVHGRTRVAAALRAQDDADEVHAVAIGKAACAMMLGAHDALGPPLARGLLITRRGYLNETACRLPSMRCVEAGHPLPDQDSLRAGTELLTFIDRTPLQGTLLFLISGGASSLVEVLPEGSSLEDLHRAARWLFGSGLPIDAVNRVRKSLSLIKGGQLAAPLRGRDARVLLISDVPGDDPGVIGSGPLWPDSPGTNLSDLGLPDWLAAMTARAPAPAASHPARIPHTIVACLNDAKQAAAEAARGMGYEVHVYGEFVSGDALACGRRLGADLLNGAAGVHVWGGETTVSLPPHPGRGGRNQSLALAAALQLQGTTGAWLLAAGTDGSDGPTEDAGALVDGGTVERGSLSGLDAPTALAAADAGTFLEASGDLVQTGPTGTNVMDLILGLRL